MRTHSLERRVSHADVDFLGELKVPALLGLLEQAAVEASTAAGFDAAWYTREGRIWIIRRTQVERFVPVGGVETVTVDTHVADFRRVRSVRRYTVRREGHVVAEANTDWVYCDMTSGRPVRIPESMQLALMDAADGEPLPRPEALPVTAPGEATPFGLVVQPSHLDHVTHVNNAVYASYLEDGAFALFAAHGWPLARMLAAGGALRIRRLDAEYVSDAQAGDALTVRSWLLNATEWDAVSAKAPAAVQLLQTIRRADATEILRAQSDWVWRNKPAVIGGVPAA